MNRRMPMLRQGCEMRSTKFRSRGFTLLELLVVMALLSLLMLAMASVMRTSAQTELRVDARLQRVDDLRVAGGFLRSVMERISAQKMEGIAAVGSSPYFFRGAPEDMWWVGVMPARYGAGGRHHFRLGLAGTGQGGQALMLQFMPWTDASAQPDWALAESATLLTGVTGISFQYEDNAEEVSAWGAPWAATDRLPGRVMISLQTAAGVWPPLIIPLRALPGSDQRSSGSTFGGGRR